jgi:23S rRNA (guanosine2251-2'-O)-methyltransferase
VINIDQFIRYEIRQCAAEDCRLRFPVNADVGYGQRCPRCGSLTRIVLNPTAKRESGIGTQPLSTNDNLGKALMEAFLDNIRSAWNVGSMFRSADGAGLRAMHLGGITPTPQNPKVKVTSLGAEKAIPWSYHANGLEAIMEFKQQGYHLWALEGGRDSDAPFQRPTAEENIFQVNPVPSSRPLLLIVGNENFGIDPDILVACERVLTIPMRGVKRSLNVAVAFGIAVYALMNAPAAIFVPKRPE